MPRVVHRGNGVTECTADFPRTMTCYPGCSIACPNSVSHRSSGNRPDEHENLSGFNLITRQGRPLCGAPNTHPSSCVVAHRLFGSTRLRSARLGWPHLRANAGYPQSVNRPWAPSAFYCLATMPRVPSRLIVNIHSMQRRFFREIAIHPAFQSAKIFHYGAPRSCRRYTPRPSWQDKDIDQGDEACQNT